MAETNSVGRPRRLPGAGEIGIAALAITDARPEVIVDEAALLGGC
jgi:hypothetical protein